MLLSTASSDLAASALLDKAASRREGVLGDAAGGVLLNAFAQVHDAPIALKEADSGVYRFVNAAMAALFGREVDEVIGRTDAQLLSVPRASALRAADHTALAHHPQPSCTDHRFEWRGRRRHFAALRVVLPDSRSPGVQLVASIWMDRGADDERDQQLQGLRTQLESDQRLIERLRHDGLGDAPPASADMRVFDDQLRRELDLSTRERREFTLVLIEIDPLSAEQAADPLSNALPMARREALERLLVANIRAMDATSRLGPDRFSVLLSGVGLATAHTRAESLRRQCAEYILMVDGRQDAFTVSIGLSSFPHSARAKDDLLRSAEKALMLARERGGNQLKLASLPFPRSTA